ncbi:hypothetical protein Pmani_011235 [Petrolisthes manimaculis]|uniref:Uncharacterized protein n=1 Tax=Petrolisthes manimaculis TaxID=1843537 RepID=A0AAE1Q144_9EUCA|nr:hypothetical protein Pmani_011235 [Petrolisthes manimaculis]
MHYSWRDDVKRKVGQHPNPDKLDRTSSFCLEILAIIRSIDCSSFLGDWRLCCSHAPHSGQIRRVKVV